MTHAILYAMLKCINFSQVYSEPINVLISEARGVDAQMQALLQGQLVVSAQEQDGTSVDATGIPARLLQADGEGI